MSLTSVIGKLLERILKDRIYLHWKKIHHDLLVWIPDCLTHIRQRVVMQECHSEWRFLTNSVLQGKFAGSFVVPDKNKLGEKW